MSHSSIDIEYSDNYEDDSDVGTDEDQGSDYEEIGTDDGNDDLCKACGYDGFVICCDTCSNSFHAYCLNPPLIELPRDEDNWYCPQCQVPETDKETERIVFWRWKHFDYPDPVEESDLLKEEETLESIDPERRKRLYLRPFCKMEPRRERELFIKWKSLPYWKCEWMSEYAYEKWFDESYKAHCNEHDMENPPELEEISSRHNKNDPQKLAERFYQYGIKPEWLQIHRIVSHEKVSENEYDYYVKWKDLGYEQSTWVADDDDYPNLMESVYNYWMHREAMTKVTMPKGVEVKVKAWRESQGLLSLNKVRVDILKEKYKFKFDAKERHEQQPEFVTSTGGSLHNYQLKGLNWLRNCWSQKVNAMLADETDLGKTIQALSFLYCLVKEGHTNGPFLIVAPLSSLIKWEREAELWTPDLHVVTYCGNKIDREIIRENEFSFSKEVTKSCARLGRMRSNKNTKFHILLTSYEMINTNKTLLSSIKWQALIVDEAQRLKNNRSLFFRNLKEYDINYRLLLTGTTPQNNLEELFHLLSLLSPDSFVDFEEFTTKFSNVSKEDQIEKLSNLLGPHMLRRMRCDILTEMPSKRELLVRVDLSSTQKTYYKNTLAKNYEALSSSEGTKASLQSILMELKRCCNHPYLFDKAHKEAPKRLDGYYEGDALIKASGKFVLMQKMLRKLKEDGHRVLVFSQMARMIDIMEDFCENEGYLFERIDELDRKQLQQEAINRFNAPNANQFIFLLSTRAGGFKINLETVDTVIIYDSGWDLNADIQAFSRTHKLSQNVMIYRFVTRNSAEEKIIAVTNKKMLLTQLVVESGFGQKDPSLSKTELDDVLRFGSSELFKGEKVGNSIVWNDQTVKSLLDRDTNNATEVDWAGDYLSSFNVAQYATREVQQVDDDPMKDVTEQGTDEESSAKYWENLLRDVHEQDKQKEADQHGGDKRVRRPVKKAPVSRLLNIPDSSNVQPADPVEAKRSKLKPQKLKLGSKKPTAVVLPPLIKQVGNQLEVLGFKYHQRKDFYDAVLLFGLSVPRLQKNKKRFEYLSTKPDRFIEAYVEMFKGHLKETGPYVNDCFSDGVPVEVFDRDKLLSNIAAIALIDQKVDKFKGEHGLFPPVINDAEKMDVDNDQPPASKTVQPFHFTIDDEGLTEINSTWENEEAATNEEQSEYRYWNKRHDYYLLCGFTIHGYLQFDEIMGDRRFAVLDGPFNRHGVVTVPGVDIKYLKARFMRGRSKLLEKALVAEDFSKRSKQGSVDNNDSVSGHGVVENLMENFDSMFQSATAPAGFASNSVGGRK